MRVHFFFTFIFLWLSHTATSQILVYGEEGARNFITQAVTPGLFDYTQRDSTFFRRRTDGQITALEWMQNGRCSSMRYSPDPTASPMELHLSTCDTVKSYTREIFYKNWGYLDSILTEEAYGNGWRRDMLHRFFYEQDELTMIQVEEYGLSQNMVMGRHFYRIFRDQAKPEKVDSIYSYPDQELTYKAYYYYDTNDRLDSVAIFYHRMFGPDQIIDIMLYNWHPTKDELVIDAYDVIRYYMQFRSSTFYSTRTGLGIDNPAAGQSLKLYPNPVKDILRVEGLKEAEGFEICTIGGRVLKSGFTAGSIHLSDLPPGIYLLKIRKSVMKLVVQ